MKLGIEEVEQSVGVRVCGPCRSAGFECCVHDDLPSLDNNANGRKKTTHKPPAGCGFGEADDTGGPLDRT
jgi:hypothetical protein